MTLRRALVILALAALATVPLGCGSGDGDSPEGEATAHSPGQVGAPAPDFRLARLDGSALQMSDLRGKAVLVDFWATWCPPCKAALPHLQELSVEYADQLVIVGIALDQGGKSVVAPFVDRAGLTFEIVLPDAGVLEAFGGVSNIPTTFLVDPRGRIAAKWIGLTSKETYESAIRAALEI